jgi:cytochrome c-type biogenesis protein CcmE
MKPRAKFLLGGLLILGSASALMATSTENTAQYFLTPSELAAKVDESPRFIKNGVKVGAKVVSGTIVREPDGRTIRFDMTDGTETFKVVYRGVAPDTFTDGVDVVVEGRLDSNGVFQATTLLAKCASRYENEPGQPGQYPQSPSYPAGA